MVALGRQADQVGVRRLVQPVLDVQVEARARAQPPGTRRDDLEVEDGVVVLGVVGLGPHLAQRAEAERLGLLLHDHGDLLHGTSVHGSWQEINQDCHSCHWWQELNGRMITAMNTIIALLVLAAVVALLVSYARHDRFAGPASTTHPVDDLGPIEERHHLVPRW